MSQTCCLHTPLQLVVAQWPHQLQPLCHRCMWGVGLQAARVAGLRSVISPGFVKPTSWGNSDISRKGPQVGGSVVVPE